MAKTDVLCFPWPKSTRSEELVDRLPSQVNISADLHISSLSHCANAGREEGANEGASNKRERRLTTSCPLPRPVVRFGGLSCGW